MDPSGSGTRVAGSCRAISGFLSPVSKELVRFERKVGVRSLAMVGGDRGDVRRRSQRLIKKKQASEEEQILRLKRELEDLRDRRRCRLMKRAQSAAATPSPCNPSQLLSAGATPSPCCPFQFPSAGPTPSPLPVSGGAPPSPCDPLSVGAPPQPPGHFRPLSAKRAGK